MLSKSALKMRRWRRKNRERQRENDRRWRKNNLKKARAKNRKWYRENRERELARNAVYHRKNRKKVAIRHRLVRRRMTQAQHDALLKKQKNRCAVCRKVFRLTPRIDHNHETDENRGLLCNHCNVLIGMSFESIRTLKNAIKYLRECR